MISPEPVPPPSAGSRSRRGVRDALGVVRGGLVLVFVLLWLGVAALPTLLLLSVPARFVSPPRRLAWVSVWARVTCDLILRTLTLGGARFVRRGHVDTEQPGVVLMNHQSVLDIPTAMLICRPSVPAFVARARYAHVPLISTGLWLADCPIIDPRRDRDGAVATMARAVREDRVLLVYPEGHRTPDGSLQPFRTAGLMAMLTERRVPVWLVATDGFWAGRRLVDLVRVQEIRGITVVLGRYDPPEDAAGLPRFIETLQEEMARGLAELRAGRA